jgi:tight adherence protein C
VNGTLPGALVGLVFAVAVLAAVRCAPPARRPRLAERIAPYLAEATLEPRPLDREEAGPPFGTAGRLLAPVLARAAARLDSVVGGRRSVRRRLAALGSRRTVPDFRLEQLVTGGVGLVAGVVLAAMAAVASGRLDVLSAALFCLAGLAGGVWGRDWYLTVQVRRREAAMLAEFPVVAELLALAVTAGEGVVAALERVARLCRGELSRELGAALGEARAGIPLAEALGHLRERTTLEPLARFADGIVIALERGTPLSEVLRAQATDVREAGKRALLEAGGRKEIAMMVTVVKL